MKKEVKNKFIKRNLFLFIILSISIFLVINIVSGDEDDLVNCCLNTTQGVPCQDVPFSFENCEEDELLPTTCDLIPECRKGCCINEEKGVCSPRVLDKDCTLGNENPKIKWEGDEYCEETTFCDEGCCILGRESLWTTKIACQKETFSRGYSEVDFSKEEVIPKADCFEKGLKKMGACKLGGGTCRFTTQAECIRLGATDDEFREGYLCSHPNIDSICGKEDSIGCIEGEDEIYWFDSCGNMENIYGTTYTGMVKTKEESCGADSEDGNMLSPTCGNCDYEKGSMCSPSSKAGGEKVEDGDYICRDLNCLEETKYLNLKGEEKVAEEIPRRNKETWCIYDGTIGLGRDIVGSRHWIAECIDGIISYTGCKDNRVEVCSEEKIENNDSEFEKTKSASCKPNNWDDCLEINSMELKDYEDGISKLRDCLEKPHCYLANYMYWMQTYEMGGGADYSASNLPTYGVMCLPQYPPGANHDDEDTNEEICGRIGTVYCNSCGAEWTEHMNDMCTSLGDCGVWPNIRGESVWENWIGRAFPPFGLVYTEKIRYHAQPKLYTSIDFVLTLIGAGAYGSGGGIGGFLLYLGGRYLPEGVGDAVGKYFLVTYSFGMGREFIVRAPIPIPSIYNCIPWSPPAGGDMCETCNTDPLRECSEYRCSSLGAACELMENDVERPICVTTEDDGTAPIISAGEISEGFIFQDEITNKEVGIRTDDGNCIRAFTVVEFSLNTDEYAQCKFDFEEEKAFDDMIELFEGGMNWEKNHSLNFTMPSKDILLAENISLTEEDLINWYANLILYVKCQDTHGNMNEEEYLVDICVKTGIDTEPAFVRTYIPENKSYFPYGDEEVNLTVFLNEPAKCKYSLDKNEDFKNMTFFKGCKTKMSNYRKKYHGWPCKVTLQNLTEEENIFYFKCKDQPWLPAANDSQKNINDEDFVYILYSSDSALNITSVSPQGETFKGKVTPIAVSFNVETDGGMYGDGVSKCEFEWEKRWYEFFETDSNTHKHEGLMLPEGDYDIPIKCKDDGGNIAYVNSTFKVEIDNDPPIYVRVYHDGGSLKLITDEKAICYHNNFDGCDFTFEDNVTSMTTDILYSIEHTASWVTDKTYYIKCEDMWENVNDDCIIVVEANSL